MTPVSSDSENHPSSESDSAKNAPTDGFAALGLLPGILKTLTDIGYERPSPIQAQCIPVLQEGHDLIGMAQTGTGKTAAFALPILQKIDLKKLQPQALVLTPTRELAIQVAEAFQTYAHHLPGFHVLPIYGGQSYGIQLKQLSRGAHVIVGTPGRVMDHLERKTLQLNGLETLILDEADEMLRMGFIDDVEWILDHTPAAHQTALFSATMPDPIRRVAQKYLVNPKEVRIKSATATVAAVRQVYWQVSGLQKLDALTRILEVEEDFDAAIIFVRTKTATVELADKLNARGYAVAALNGDLNQAMRERVLDQIKSGALDILVATDVAARGIDVARVSHVINYDIPYDTEAYVHRIGRTGRAGRAGNAILFVAPREIRMLRSIERATRQPISPLTLPTRADVTQRRVLTFKEKVSQNMGRVGMEFFSTIARQIAEENEVGMEEVAAALAMMAQENKPLQAIGEDPPASAFGREDSGRDTHGRTRESRPAFDRGDRPDRSSRSKPEGDRPRREARSDRPFEDRPPRADRGNLEERPARPPREDAGDKVRYRIDVGRMHGVEVRDIVGAIANESGLDSRFIGRIALYEESSTLELPAGMPKQSADALKRTRIRGVPINLRQDGNHASSGDEESHHSSPRPRRDAPAFSDRPKREASDSSPPFSDRPRRGASDGAPPFSDRPKRAAPKKNFGDDFSKSRKK